MGADANGGWVPRCCKPVLASCRYHGREPFHLLFPADTNPSPMHAFQPLGLDGIGCRTPSPMRLPVGFSLGLVITSPSSPPPPNRSSYILRYLRQIAVITPYAQFMFAYKAEDDKNSVRIGFRCVCAVSCVCVCVRVCLRGWSVKGD